MNARRSLVIGASLLAIVACSAPPRPLSFARIDATREQPSVKAAREGSPALFAKAEALRAQAEADWKAGDRVAADLHAEQALASYAHAVVAARLTSATVRGSREREREAKAEESRKADEAARLDVDRDADRIEAEVGVRREALTPTASGPTDPARTAARWVAARSHLAAATALCEGAKLLAPDAKGGEEARRVLGEVTSKVDAGKGEPPIDATTRVRQLCLQALTRARDAAIKGGGATGDALLGALSGMGGYGPVRDERGVVATIEQSPAPSFEGGKLNAKGRARVEALGRVAKSYPGFAILVVVHAAAGGASANDKARAEATIAALVSGGADRARIGTQLAGSTLPAFDPQDAKSKARNERVEIIFVGGAP
jgi:hypothetical protein